MRRRTAEKCEKRESGGMAHRRGAFRWLEVERWVKNERSRVCRTYQGTCGSRTRRRAGPHIVMCYVMEAEISNSGTVAGAVRQRGRLRLLIVKAIALLLSSSSETMS
jgi:hypothetical protein